MTSSGAIDWGARVVPYPSADAERFRSLGLWGERTIAQELRLVVEAHPDAPAVIAPDGMLTFAELDAAADRAALGLHQSGLRPADRILLQVYNSAAAVVAWYAALKAGLIPVCTLPQHRQKEISEIAAASGAAAHLVQCGHGTFDLVGFAKDIASRESRLNVLVALGSNEPLPPGVRRFEELGHDCDAATARVLVEAIQATISPDDVAVFQLSGGTTSVPKIIPRLHAEYWYNARAWAHAWDWTHNDRPAHMLPLVHNAGITCGLHSAHAVGAALVLSRPDPEVSGPLLADAGATDMIVNTAVVNFAREHPRMDEALQGLKRFVWSGSKLPSWVIERYERATTTIVQLFGMGEGLFTLTPVSASVAQRHKTVGVPLSEQDEIRIYEPGTTREAEPGAEGELCCRGPYTIRGYFDADDRNREAFTGDGFYRTGDLGRIENVDGVDCLFIEGRLKDVISRGGEKINAEEVELLALTHRAVREAAVVAMPDPRLGERACVYVVCAPGEKLDLGGLTKHLEECGLAKFKWPERLELVSHMPSTNVGKIDKKALREDIAVRLSHDEPAATAASPAATDPA